jgi:hypothetical protein
MNMCGEVGKLNKLKEYYILGYVTEEYIASIFRAEEGTRINDSITKVVNSPFIQGKLLDSFAEILICLYTASWSTLETSSVLGSIVRDTPIFYSEDSGERFLFRSLSPIKSQLPCPPSPFFTAHSFIRY